MKFNHDDTIWDTFPQLRAYALHIKNVQQTGDTTVQQRELQQQALDRLGGAAESELPAIKAWRQAYSAMGYKPTQYRCASESLLRRLRKSGDLPRIHPFVDLCNSASTAFALPVAAFDVRRVSGSLTVMKSDATERYQAFDGSIETPEPGEVIFRDEDAQAHARRWVHRQSALSAISPDSDEALVVIEGFHEGVEDDLVALAERLESSLAEAGSARIVMRAALTPTSREMVLGT